ncbi:Protein SOSEKI 1 [Sporothrix stenoceras]|uniref:Protein SOSEKI 1 n=1 Tax=Sporothrix stenoceras TaxID=5173 RepID=A0ABR3YX34_9PEZI
MLSELDINKIVLNPTLRHDINYDRLLSFIPKLNCESGRSKQEKVQQFWSGLHHDLTQFVANRKGFLRAHGPNDNDWSLPILLNEVKDIIQTLVPAQDHDMLEEVLDILWLMQQFARGMLDIEKLAGWLSSVLKTHCAPMRDKWVNNMCKELKRGHREKDIDELVAGMTSLLRVLTRRRSNVP